MVGLDSSYDLTLARGVSADGSTVVGDASTASGSQPTAWQWTESDGVQGLGMGLISSHAASSDGSVIAADGVAVVMGSLVTQASRWSPGTGPVSLGSLPGTTGSGATGISGDGSVLVGFHGSFSPPSNFTSEAFRWTSVDGMVGLGDLPGGAFQSDALAVSADGSVVVGSGDFEEEPFIWDETNGMRSLTSVLADLGLDLTGWDLTAATGISADGLTIVGDGFNPSGAREAWIAVIPEPRTGLLVMAGLLGLAGWRRRIGSLPQ